MKHYLIKQLNCIVSDAEIKEGFVLYDNSIKEIYKESITPNVTIWLRRGTKLEDDLILERDSNIEVYKSDCKKIEYSNNKIDGLKPFELVDEVEELAEKLYPENIDGDYTGEICEDSCYDKRKAFTADYKAKAGCTESQMIGFAEWIIENQASQYGDTKMWEYFNKYNQKIDCTSKELLTLYLQEQESRPIEVQMIQDSVFKIKNN